MPDTIEKEEFLTEEASSSHTERFLTFMSDGLIFGVGTNHVMEIITNHNIRSVPMVPDYIRGIINLRGMVVPVMDIRLRMNKPFVEYTSNTCIIILEIDSTQIGIAVDTVLQVQDIDQSKASKIPTSNKLKLAEHMITLEDSSTVFFLDCNALIRV